MRAISSVAAGYKFSLFTWWIRQAIAGHCGPGPHHPRAVHMIETINKLVRTQRQLVRNCF